MKLSVGTGRGSEKHQAGHKDQDGQTRLPCRGHKNSHPRVVGSAGPSRPAWRLPGGVGGMGCPITRRDGIQRLLAHLSSARYWPSSPNQSGAHLPCRGPSPPTRQLRCRRVPPGTRHLLHPVRWCHRERYPGRNSRGATHRTSPESLRSDARRSRAARRPPLPPR